MTHEQEQQFVSAILNAGGDHYVRKLGIQPEWLENVEARGGLRAIYEFTDAGHDGVPGPAWLQERLVTLPAYNGVESLESLAQAVRLAQLRRHILSSTQHVTNAVLADPREAANRLVAITSDPDFTNLLTDSSESTLLSGLDELIAPHVNQLDDGGIIGLPTPWEPLTFHMKGLKPAEFMVIFADEKNYKSRLSLEFVRKVFDTGYRVLIVSSEMPAQEINEILLCASCQLDYNRFLDRNLGPQDVQKMMDYRATIQQRAADGIEIHHLTPSGHGVQTAEEVRAKAIELNHDGKLGLILWDGHYRSAKSEEWTDIYQLVRRTRHVSLDEHTGQVPIIATTQEGSEKGKVAYKAYGQEATIMLRARKRSETRAELTTVRIRKGRHVKLLFNVDFTRTAFDLAGEQVQGGTF